MKVVTWCFSMKLIKFSWKCTLKLTVYQVACVLTIVFFYALLVVWPSQDRFSRSQFGSHIKGNILGKRNYEFTFGACGNTPTLNYTTAFKEVAKRVVRKTTEPVIVWWTKNWPWIEDRHCPGDFRCKIFSSPIEIDRGAYLFYGTATNIYFPLPRRPQSIIWGILHEESPRHVPALMHEKGRNLFNFSSTYSRYSDVPMPLFYLGSLTKITNKAYYFVDTHRKNFYVSKGLAPVLYIQSNCETTTERDTYVKKLLQYIDIDSYGECLNNKRMPIFKNGTDLFHNLSDDKFLRFVARYKFTIAIENAVCNDYTTEKLWRPISVGSVPIYFGSPTIRDWLPNNKSAILLEDYRTPKALSEHLKKLLADDKLYEEYLEHKTKGIITNQILKNELKARPYQTDYSMVREKFECFICEKLHDKNISKDVSVMKKSHFDCPKPISALSLQVNPFNKYVKEWDSLNIKVNEMYERVFGVK